MAQDSTRPNVVFLFTDDQRHDTIRALGNSAIHTPHMDRLVSRGTALTHAHIPCGTSGAVCMPSRAMLHTGRSLFRIEGAGERLAPDHTTLGEAFRGAGYRTFGCGKWHNGRESYQRSFTDGAEIFFGGMADHWNVPAYHFDPSGRYDATCLVCDDPCHSNSTRARECDHIHAGRHSTDTIGEAAVQFIGRQDERTPFLAYVSFLAPHDPRTMPERFRALYRADDLELPANFLPEHPFDNGALRIRDELLAAFPRTPDEIRRHLAEYYAMISHLDWQVGRIVEAVAARGWLERTIFVLAGDNGLALGQHGLMGKQSCYDHSVRVPLVWAGPGVAAGRQTGAWAYLFDIFPTLCDLCGVARPASVEGRSLAPVLAGTEQVARERLYFAYTGLHRAVRVGRHKLIEVVVGDCRTTQLFDLAEDPWERRNLAEEPSGQAVVAALRAELRAGAEEWGDEATVFGQEYWSRYRAAGNFRRG